MIRRIAVFLPNWVGDATMATPALRSLRSHFGATTEIVGILRPLVAEVLDGSPWLDRVWHYDRSGGDPGAGRAALLARLRGIPVDLSIHFTNDFASALVARLGGVRRRAGYVRNRRGFLLTDRLHAPRCGREWLPVSAVDYYLDLVRAVGCGEVATHLELATTPRDEAAADRAWADLGLASGERPVVLNSSGAFGGAKLWPERSCAALAGRVARELGAAVVVLCGPAESERARRIAAAAAHPRVSSLAGRPLSIGLSKSVVRRARCLVSTDSGPRHLGAAFGVPVVALFGPTDPAWTDTRHPGEVRLAHLPPCAPCGRRECPLGHHACMEDLAVDDVFREVERVVVGEWAIDTAATGGGRAGGRPGGAR